MRGEVKMFVQDNALVARIQSRKVFHLYGAEGDKRPRAQPLKKGAKPEPRPDRSTKPKPADTSRDAERDAS